MEKELIGIKQWDYGNMKHELKKRHRQLGTTPSLHPNPVKWVHNFWSSMALFIEMGTQLYEDSKIYI